MNWSCRPDTYPLTPPCRGGSPRNNFCFKVPLTSISPSTLQNIDSPNFTVFCTRYVLEHTQSTFFFSSLPLILLLDWTFFFSLPLSFRKSLTSISLILLFTCIKKRTTVSNPAVHVQP